MLPGPTFPFPIPIQRLEAICNYAFKKLKLNFSFFKFPKHHHTKHLNSLQLQPACIPFLEILSVYMTFVECFYWSVYCVTQYLTRVSLMTFAISSLYPITYHIFITINGWYSDSLIFLKL